MSTSGFLGASLYWDDEYPVTNSIYRYGTWSNISATGSYTDGYGNSFSFSDSDISISFGDYSWNSATFNGIQISEAAGAPAIAHAYLIGTSVSGIDQSDISWNATTVWVNWQGTATYGHYYYYYNGYQWSPDFADVRVYPPDQYAGLIVLRPRAQTIPAIERLAEQMVRYLASEPLSGHLWIVEEQRLRVREGGTSGSP